MFVPVAQLDRVFGYEPKGQGFESLQARQKRSSLDERFFFFHYILYLMPKIVIHAIGPSLTKIGRFLNLLFDIIPPKENVGAYDGIECG